MARRALLSSIALILALVAGSGLVAAAVTVKSGVLDKVSPDGKTISVKFAHSEGATELTVAPHVNVRYDGKATELSALKPGMSVTVQIDGKEAQLVIARAASEEQPRPMKTGKPSTSKAKTTSKSTSKTSVARKSKTTPKKSTKSRDSGPGPLDDMPYATTPLASLGDSAHAKNNGPSPLDSMPAATTPLAGGRTNGNRNGPSPLDNMPAATTPLAK